MVRIHRVALLAHRAELLLVKLSQVVLHLADLLSVLVDSSLLVAALHEGGARVVQELSLVLRVWVIIVVRLKVSYVVIWVQALGGQRSISVDVHGRLGQLHGSASCAWVEGQSGAREGASEVGVELGLDNMVEPVLVLDVCELIFTVEDI